MTSETNENTAADNGGIYLTTKLKIKLMHCSTVRIVLERPKRSHQVKKLKSGTEKRLPLMSEMTLLALSMETEIGTVGARSGGPEGTGGSEGLNLFVEPGVDQMGWAGDPQIPARLFMACTACKISSCLSFLGQ